MATFKAVIRKDQTNSEGVSNIKIRVTHNRTAEYIATDLYVNPDNFRGTATGENSEFINSRITDYLQIYQRRYLQLGDAVLKMNSREVRDAIIKEHGNDSIDFHRFMDGYINDLKENGKKGCTRGYTGLVKHLKDFRSKLSFQQIDSLFLTQFERYMRRAGVRNAIPSYMARLRVVFNRGRDRYNDEDRGVIRIANYPFRKYKIEPPKVESNDYSLSIDQVRTLLTWSCKTRRESLAVDVFSAMICLMGVNGCDLYVLPPPSKAGRISYTRSKTQHKFSVKVEPELSALIAKRKGGVYAFNFSQGYGNESLFTKAVNTGLKSICKAIHKADTRADFPGHITSNWARHTWASIARNDCGVSKDDVALCLGHKDIDNRVTDMYIRYDHTIQDAANRKVLDKLFKISINNDIL